MRKTLLVMGALFAMAAAASAQTPQMPAPGPEQKNLAYFEGTWKFEGKLHASPFGPEGAMTGTETCQMFQGGWHLVCDSQGTSPMGSMKGHTLMTYDHQTRQYRYFSVSTMPEAEMAEGTFADGTWTWTNEVTMEGKKIQSRFLMKEVSPTSYTMKWEMSTDGTEWKPVMEGTSTKTTS